jgi:thioredoxin-related protein
MKALIVILFLHLAFLSLAQSNRLSEQIHTNGIKFEENLTWKQIKIKAKRENKGIFVDCFATWCLPCEKMNRDVFVIDSIGWHVNDKYVSIRLQLDTNKRDNQQVKKWYSFAHQIIHKYNITILPSFLFFDSNGEILHKDVGAKNVKEFIELTSKAADPGQQYYTLLKLYESGRIVQQELPYLSNMASMVGDKNKALEIAGKYIRNYLQVLPDSLFFTRANIEFIGPYLKSISSKDNVFKRYYNNIRKVDGLIEIDGYTRAKICSIIYREEVNFLPNTTTFNNPPDWELLKNIISKKYDSSYANEIVLSAKINWYHDTKQWSFYSKYLVERMKQYGLNNVPHNINGLLFLNNNAWSIFRYSTNKDELAEAIKWTEMALVIDSSFQIMDTKANLLYKAGNIEQAIALEEKVLQIIIETKAVERYKKECIITLDKMRRGEPTWTKI